MKGTTRTINCRLCNQEIVFDGVQRSERTGKQIPLDPTTKQPHNCPNYEPYVSTGTVTVTAAAKTSSGNPSSTATTTTVQEIKYIKCKSCNNDIYFDEKQKSESGKFIPISRLTNQPHQCKYNSVSRKYHPAEWNGEREAEAVAEAVANKAKESK